jgi:hypothetical protein
MIRRGGLDGLPWVRMGGGLVPREEREEQGRRATIKAHPTPPHPPSPLLKLMGFSQVDAYWVPSIVTLSAAKGLARWAEILRFAQDDTLVLSMKGRCCPGLARR